MIIGIDPGLKGGLTCITPGGEIYFSIPMQVAANEIDLKGLKTIVLDAVNTLQPKTFSCFIEKAQAMPKNGVVSMFRYGTSYGELRGLFFGLGFTTTLVRPREWQSVMHQGTDADLGPKERSLVASMRLFPSVSFLATPRCKKPHDGIIDSALIAMYGHRLLFGNVFAGPEPNRRNAD